MTVPTYSDLLAQTAPWYVAHRGNYTYHPEHTLLGYKLSMLAVPEGLVPAVEVSVRKTIDNQIVAMHDASLARTTDDSVNIADRYYPHLHNKVVVDIGAKQNGPAWQNQPIPLLADVLDQIGNRCVIFLEPKVSDQGTIDLIFALLDKYEIDPASIVWKAYRSNTVGGGGGAPLHMQQAIARGHGSWIYLDAADTDAYFDTAATYADAIGLPVESADAKITHAVGTGTPVMCWEVHRQSERDRLVGLGVKGMMCSGERYVRDNEPSGSTKWDTGIRAPGEIPSVKDNWSGYGFSFESNGAGGWTEMAKLDIVGTNPSTLLGSISKMFDPTNWTMTWDQKWDTLPSTVTTHGDVIVCELDDRPYIYQGTDNAGGYHCVFRADGSVQLYKHTNGSGSGTQLGSTVSTTAPTAGVMNHFRFVATPTQVKFARLDNTGAVMGTEIVVNDTTFRGKYIHMAKASSNSPVSFGNFERS